MNWPDIRMPLHRCPNRCRSGPALCFSRALRYLFCPTHICPVLSSGSDPMPPATDRGLLVSFPPSPSGPLSASPRACERPPARKRPWGNGRRMPKSSSASLKTLSGPQKILPPLFYALGEPFDCLGVELCRFKRRHNITFITFLHQ